MFLYKDGELYCEDINISKIATEVKTPFYLYSSKTILSNLHAYFNAFPGALICYAYKANASMAICKLLAREGAGADVLSGGELFKALKAGVPKERIVFNGNGKLNEEMEQGILAGILMFNVDSFHELKCLSEIGDRLNKKVAIGVRVNPNIDPQTHPYIATSLKTSKFGLSEDEAVELYKKAQNLKNIECIGIHTHLGSQITYVEPFREATEKLIDIIKLLEKMGIELKYINLGGGLGISYKEKESVPTQVDLAKALNPLLSKINCQVILEPGRSIVGPAGILVTKVISVKRTKEKNFIVVDAGMNDLIRPALYQAHHRVISIKENVKAKELFDVVGPLCEEGDFLSKNTPLSEPKPGDILAIMDVGAYGFSMSSNYNSRPRPAEVMVNKDSYSIIRKKETYEDLL